MVKNLLEIQKLRPHTGPIISESLTKTPVIVYTLNMRSSDLEDIGKTHGPRYLSPPHYSITIDCWLSHWIIVFNTEKGFDQKMKIPTLSFAWTYTALRSCPWSSTSPLLLACLPRKGTNSGLMFFNVEN